MRCAYSVLRFVPDPVRGEFVNVGVLVGSDATRQSSVKLVRTRQRASHLADSDVVKDFWSYLLDLRSEVDSTRNRDWAFSESWLHDLWEASGNLLQLSEPAPIAAGDVQTAAARLAEQFLADRRVLRRASGVPTRSTARAQVRKAYKEMGLEPSHHFLERSHIRGGTHEAVFDFVVRHESAVQLTQTWNFRVREPIEEIEKVKAWAWTVRDIRANGGRGSVEGAEFDVPRDVDVRAAVVEPESGTEREVLSEAEHAFTQIDVKPVPFNKANRIAEYAADRLAAAA